jgi:hypothetical protein
MHFKMECASELAGLPADMLICVALRTLGGQGGGLEFSYRRAHTERNGCKKAGYGNSETYLF